MTNFARRGFLAGLLATPIALKIPVGGFLEPELAPAILKAGDVFTISGVYEPGSGALKMFRVLSSDTGGVVHLA